MLCKIRSLRLLRSQCRRWTISLHFWRPFKAHALPFVHPWRHRLTTFL